MLKDFDKISSQNILDQESAVTLTQHGRNQFLFEKLKPLKVSVYPSKLDSLQVEKTTWSCITNTSKEKECIQMYCTCSFMWYILETTRGFFYNVLGEQ